MNYHNKMQRSPEPQLDQIQKQIPLSYIPQMLTGALPKVERYDQDGLAEYSLGFYTDASIPKELKTLLYKDREGRESNVSRLIWEGRFEIRHTQEDIGALDAVLESISSSDSNYQSIIEVLKGKKAQIQKALAHNEVYELGLVAGKHST